jgi:hypothetical protein
MQFKRIKYVSRCARDLKPADIDAIVAVSQRNNAARGVTGAMALSGRLFYQVLEGPPDVIDALYAKIAADPRHSDVTLLRSQAQVPMRMFAKWSMRIVNLEETEASRLEPLRELLMGTVELRERSDQMAATLERALATWV